MPKLDKLINNEVFNSISILWIMQLVSGFCAFLTQVFLARYFEISEYGSIVTALAVITFVSPIAGFGTGNLRLRCFGKEGWEAFRWIKPSIKAVLLTSALTFSLVWLWALLVESNSLVRVLIILFSIFVFSQAALELASSAFQLQSKYVELALLQALPNILKFFVAIIVVVASFNVKFLAYGYFITGLALVLYCLLYINNLVKSDISLHGHGPRPQNLIIQNNPSSIQVLNDSWPFVLAGIFYFIYFQIDLIMINSMLGPEYSAKYNTAVVILTATYTVPTVVFQKYLLPKYHIWAEHDKQRFYNIFCYSNRIVFLVGFAIGIVTAFLSHWIIELLFGVDYHDAGIVLLILSLCIPLRYLSTSVGAALVTGTNMRRKVVYQGIVALCNVLLNLMLIPRMGIIGAAISTVLSEALLLALYIFGAMRHVFVLNNGWECFYATNKAKCNR